MNKNFVLIVILVALMAGLYWHMMPKDLELHKNSELSEILDNFGPAAKSWNLKDGGFVYQWEVGRRITFLHKYDGLSREARIYEMGTLTLRFNNAHLLTNWEYEK
jgi:hypothetical protein